MMDSSNYNYNQAMIMFGNQIILPFFKGGLYESF